MGLKDFILNCERYNKELRKDIEYYKNKNQRLQQKNEELKKELSNDHQIKMKRLQQENRELKQQLDCSLGFLSENCPPCEKDGFMDKHSDYCERNCGVDEEIFKKCWLMYIKDKVSEVEDK